MRLEYLLFDLFIAAPLVLVATLRPRWFRGGWEPAVRSVVIAAAPFIAWDAAVVGRHWWFHTERTLPLRLLGLPLEEWAFFLVVPMACLVFWELALSAARARPSPKHNAAYLIFVVLPVPALWALATGRDYTALSAIALAVSALFDVTSGTRVLSTPRGWALVLGVLGFTGLFNGYLTARPIVLYDETFQIPLRVGTIPLEDFGFGLALVLLSTSLYQSARGRQVAPSLLGRLIRRRLGGYRRVVEPVDTVSAPKLAHSRSVAVIGGGLAGLSAAELLSRRGFDVTLIEKNTYLGGKIASWREPIGGSTATIEHGFHAFFTHYYNLFAWLDELDISRRLTPIADYLLLRHDGQRFSFREVNTTPVLNLLALKRAGLYRWRDVMRPKTGQALEQFLRYRHGHTERAFDTMSYAEFAESAALPKSLRTVFTCFSRAFFADEHRMSMGEMMKAFHFYYLSHDHGLLFRHVTGATSDVVLAPIIERLRRQHVTMLLGTAVDRIEWDGHSFRIGKRVFDRLLLASDVSATRRIVDASPSLLEAAPSLRSLKALPSGQRYSVLRVWHRGEVDDGMLPAFVTTERAEALDAFAFAHRLDEDAAAWAKDERGVVLELHCYAVPDAMRSEDVGPTMERELERFVPGFRSSQVAHRHLQIRDDFTAFHVGLGTLRPGIDTELSGLKLAGDWVALPFPAMLMEAAHSSARLAVNALCRAEGVRSYAIDAVPLHGILAKS